MINKELNEKQILASCTILKSLTSADFETTYKKSERVEFKRHSDKEHIIIFDKGEVGKCLYVIIDGAVDLISIESDGQEKIVASYKKQGDFFGEQALFDSLRKRTSRAVVTSDFCTLRKIYKKEFDKIILAKQDGLYEKLNGIGNQQLQKDSLIFSNFLYEHAHKVKEEYFDNGAFVIREGDRGERFYLILDGIARVFRGGNLIAELIEGNYFGDAALIKKQPHQISIKASDNLKVVSIDGIDFLRLYETSTIVKEYIHSMNSFDRTDRGIVYSQHKSHYKNQNSLTTILTYPNGEACSITKVVGKSHVIKFAKQVDAKTPDGCIVGKKDVELETAPVLKDSGQAQYPIFYLENNRLIGAEINAEYANLSHIVPAIEQRKIIWPWQKALYRAKGDLWIKNAHDDPTDNAVICSCMGITRGELKRVAAFGCTGYEQLAHDTGASLACGVCKSSVTDIAASADMEAAALVSNSATDNYCNKAQNIKYFRFKPKHSTVKTYIPGQHISLEAEINGQWIQRSYTLTSNANQQDYYEVAVRRNGNGVFSNWLHDRVNEQSEFRISKPQGQFHLNPDTTDPIVSFVGGIGVTPAISFLRYLISVNRKAPLYIDYSVSTNDDFAYEQELNNIREEWFKVNLRVTQHGSNRVSEQDVREIVNQYRNADFYICGSKLYEETLGTYLRNSRVEKGKIHSEQFDSGNKRSKALLSSSLLTLCLALLFFIAPSYTTPDSVSSFDPTMMWLDFVMMWDNFGYIRQNYFPSDMTGYSILGVGLLGLLMSLPRRWAWVRSIDFDGWRLMHVGLGIAALILLFLHTGFAMGGLHTTLLMSCFLGLFILGSAAGMVIALQEKISPARTHHYKKWFKRVHIGMSGLLPVLLGAHIISMYWF